MKLSSELRCHVLQLLLHLSPQHWYSMTLYSLSADVSVFLFGWCSWWLLLASFKESGGSAPSSGHGVYLCESREWTFLSLLQQNLCEQVEQQHQLVVTVPQCALLHAITHFWFTPGHPDFLILRLLNWKWSKCERCQVNQVNEPNNSLVTNWRLACVVPCPQLG